TFAAHAAGCASHQRPRRTSWLARNASARAKTGRRATGGTQRTTWRIWLATSATSPRVSEHRPARSSRGYDRGALADCVIATLKALGGAGEAESIAPDPILTSRAAARPGH